MTYTHCSVFWLSYVSPQSLRKSGWQLRVISEASRTTQNYLVVHKLCSKRSSVTAKHAKPPLPLCSETLNNQVALVAATAPVEEVATPVAATPSRPRPQRPAQARHQAPDDVGSKEASEEAVKAVPLPRPRAGTPGQRAMTEAEGSSASWHSPDASALPGNSSTTYTKELSIS
jgi:hypothetical protein